MPHCYAVSVIFPLTVFMCFILNGGEEGGGLWELLILPIILSVRLNGVLLVHSSLHYVKVS